MAVPFIVPVGILAIAGLVLAGGSSSSTEPVKPVLPPKTQAERRAGRTAICTCYRGGAQEFYALAVCALSAIYPTSPNDWRPLVDAALDESSNMDAGTRRAIKWVRGRVTGLLKLQTEDERAAWCGEEDEDDDNPGDVLPVPPVPEPDRIERAREMFLALRSSSPAGASFWQPGNDGKGELATAKAVLQSYGIGSPSSAQQTAYAKLMEASAYNQALYGRIAKSGETIKHNGRTIRTLYLPRHADAAAAIMAGKKPKRTIYDNGNKISGSGGNRYGMPWLPGVDAGALASGYVVGETATAEPPAELLALLEGA